MKIVFDTSAWIEYFLGSHLGKKVESYLQSEDVVTPVIVLMELSYRADKEGWDFEKYVNFIKIKSNVVGITEDQVLSFGKIYNDVRKRIKDFGLADAIILSTSLAEEAKILTKDSHFSGFPRAVLLK